MNLINCTAERVQRVVLDTFQYVRTALGGLLEGYGGVLRPLQSEERLDLVRLCHL